jgi:hypothetical protein
MSIKTKTSYIVGHYVQYYVSRDFRVEFTHNDLKSAFESFEHLCREIPHESDVEIRKQTTETIVSRIYDPNIDCDQSWKLPNQS